MKEKIILHRGYKGKYPENSITAFERALEGGFSFETDIRVSRDNVPFLIHDEGLDRLFNGAGKIKELNSEELIKFRYLENEELGLVSLTELCELIEKYNYNKLIFIHIKELDDIKEVIRVLDSYNLSSIIRFFACDEITMKLIEIIREKYPQYKVGLHLFENSPCYNKEDFEIADFIWADEISFKWIDKEKVEFAHKIGRRFYAISPELIPESKLNVEERWREFLSFEVDAVCTDKPEEFSRFCSLTFS